MDFWANDWVKGISIAVIAGVILIGIAEKWKREKSRPPTQTATVHTATGGTNVANTGTIGTVNLHPPVTDMAEASVHARYLVREKQRTLIVALSANVERINGYLKQIIEKIERWSADGPGLHAKIDECRAEFLRLRPELAAVHRPEEVEMIDNWQEEVGDLGKYMTTEMTAWGIYSSLPPGADAPPDRHISPAVKKVEMYKRVLNTGGSMAWTCADIKKKIDADLRS